MSDQGTVSTAETLEPHNAMTVHTEENIAPAEPPADDSGTSQTPDASAAPKKDEKPKRDRRSERTIKQLRRELAESEEARTATDQKVAELSGRVEALTAAAPKAPEPELKDFETAAEYGKAYAAWDRDSQPAPPPAAPAATPPPATPPQAVTRDDPFAEERTTLMEAGQEKYGDEFAIAMQAKKDPVPCNLDMRDFLFDQEGTIGADVFMYLDDNRAEAAKIYEMGPTASAKAMDKIAKQVKAEPPDPGGTIEVADSTKAPDPRVTKQPEPPETVPTGAAPTEVSLEDASMDEYAVKRLAQEKRDRVR